MHRLSVAAVALLLMTGTTIAQTQANAPGASVGFKVVLLGTAGGPTFDAQRLGIGTLVIAGPEVLLFDAGRSISTGMVRAAVSPADVTNVFLTHLHSDHVASLPELLLFPWASDGRAKPFRVWGPDGTRAMMEHLQEAFAFDIHVRRDVDEHFPAEGINVIATDVKPGTVYDANGVKVTAFLVDHAPVAPAFGYRVDYRGHSVALSGDTRPSDSLVEAARGVDVLVHELGRWKHDPALSGPPDELLPGRRTTRAQALTIAQHHTDPEEAGRIFASVKPKLAVFSHYNVIADPSAALRLVRQNYSGAVEFGEDSMTLEIGDTVTVHRASASPK